MGKIGIGRYHVRLLATSARAVERDVRCERSARHIDSRDGTFTEKDENLE